MRNQKLVAMGLATAMAVSSLSLAGCASKTETNTTPTGVSESVLPSSSDGVNEAEDIEDKPTEADVETIESKEDEEVKVAKQLEREELQMLISDKSYEQASKLLKADENSNYSAFSLYYAMAMLGLGADEETKDSIDKFLGADFVDNTESLAELMGEFNSETSPFSVANAEFIDDSVKLNSDYESTIKDSLRADIQTIDFANETEANSIINSWITEKTNGMIKEGMGVTSQDVIDIINAVYFKDSWNLFNESNTNKEDFTLSNGEKVQVDMMHAYEQDDVAYFKGDGFKRITIPMNNSRFEIVLPDGKDITELMENLEDTFSGGKSPNKMYEVNISLPKFKFETSTKLNDFLEQSGLGIIFADGANFSKLGTSDGASLYVGNVNQKTAIDVTEKGVEAAAVTEIGMKMMSAEVTEKKEIIDFVVDKPVIFSIVSNNGIPMFVGTLANPLK